ncbi:MAG: hypothetical protein IH591_06730 [Bacteroidales bacterium]|nr:hypothetical protein [Bacteroidales bacterium]
MKKISRIIIKDEKLLTNKDLITLKGGDDYGDGCGGRACKTDSDCCSQNPICMDLPNWPDLRVCVSP